MSDPAVSPTRRVDHVASVARTFTLTMERELSGLEGTQRLEEFAAKAEGIARTKSRAMQKHLSSHDRDLTNHAAHMRTVSAHIILLRDGLVPALKIDQASPTIRGYAIAVMGYLWAEFQAMDNLMD